MMNGWIDVTKNTEARERGLEQELDACLITVVFFVGFFVCQKRCFYVVVHLYWRKGGVAQKSLQT